MHGRFPGLSVALHKVAYADCFLLIAAVCKSHTRSADKVSLRHVRSELYVRVPCARCIRRIAYA